MNEGQETLEYGEDYGRKVYASRIKGKVLWLNPQTLPFSKRKKDWEELTLFISSSSNNGLDENLQNKRVCIFPGHGRSLVLGGALFLHNNLVYRDIALKGAGHVSRERSLDNVVVAVPDNVSLRSSLDLSISGIFNLTNARADIKTSLRFNELGIRTTLPLALIELKEIVCNGEIINIEQAKKRNLIFETDTPVIEVRAFGSAMRIDDLGNNRESVNIKIISDAINLIRRESGLQEMSFDEYVKWFTATLGANLGKMHNNGFVHGYLHSGNITVDCRIVDLDSVRKIDSHNFSETMEEDILKSWRSFKKLIDLLIKYKKISVNLDNLINIFLNSYTYRSGINIDPRRLENNIRAALY